MEKIINYGINQNYLKHWGINEALREIFQNFLDYGEYKIYTEFTLEHIIISNSYNPENLEFLSVGYSQKQGRSKRGKYGEGLKMAMLVLAREGIICSITLKDKIIVPLFVETELGKIFSIKIITKESNFNTSFVFEIVGLNMNIFVDFYESMIKKEDIIFTAKPYGKVVKRNKGDIYSGGLFVTNVSNLSNAYDISPEYLELDRDRKTPKSFDINYYCSVINSEYGKFTAEDLTHNDCLHINKIPQHLKKNLRPVLIGNEILVQHKEKGKKTIIKNQNLEQLIQKDPFFTSIIKRIKRFVAKKLGIYDLLIEFKEKHLQHFQPEVINDFDIILEKIKENE